MKKSIFLLVIVLLACMSDKLLAQTERDKAGNTRPGICGSDQALKLNLKLDPGLLDRLREMQQSQNKKYGNNTTSSTAPTTPYIIPVVFHVIQNGSTPTPMPSYTQIQWQLASLNAAYSNHLNQLNNVPNGPQGANVQVQFCLAKYMQAGGSPASWPNSTPGMINYTTSNSDACIVDITNNTSYSALAALTNFATAFPGNMYLNIFCVPQITSSPPATLFTPPSVIGVGMFPWMTVPIDGVVMRSDCIGNNTYGNFTGNMLSALDKGNILVHEVGHYLGLFHTFESITGTPPDINTAGTGVSCYGSITPYDEGDLIFDTPPTAINSQIPGPQNTCNESYAPYGAAADENDQLENFMSYSDDDVMNTFTYYQGTRIWGALDNSWSTYFLTGQRANLHTPANLSATGVSASPACGNPLFATGFNYTVDLLSVSCTSASVSFVTPALPGFLTINGYTWDFGDGTTSTLANPTHIYTLPGYSYVVTVTITCGVSTVVQSTTVNIPAAYPAIVGQSGDTIAVCNGSEQTILVYFPPGYSTAVISDGTTTYTVNNNFVHSCSSPLGTYVFPFTFSITASGTWSMVSNNCGGSVATFTVVDCCSNLVYNGGFDAGGSGFYSDYVISPVPCLGFGCAAVNGGFLGVDSDMFQSFPSPTMIHNPGARKIIVGQAITGLQPSTNYYISFKTLQSFDSIMYSAPDKFNMRLYSSAGTDLNSNCLPSTRPPVTCETGAGTLLNTFQIFNFVITTPSGISSSTQFSLELSEVDQSSGGAFDYAFDNITLCEMASPITITPLTSTLCLGDAVKLVADGHCVDLKKYDLTWLPLTGLSCYNCPNPTASPGVSTIYTLTATPPPSTPPLPVITQTVAVYIQSPVMTASSPTPLCYPATFTLNAGGVNISTITWQPGNYMSNDYEVTDSGTYTVIVETKEGCTMVGTVTVNQLVEDLTVYAHPYCTNSNSPGALSATYIPTNAGTATYTWEPGGLVGQTQTVTPSVSTIYTVFVTTPGGCTMQGITQVIVTASCCPQNYVAAPLSGTITGGIITGPKTILNDIVIDGSPGVQTKFTGEFLIGPNVKITVKPGHEFWLNEAHLYACGINMWQGITVEDGSAILSNNNTLIEDAIVAIDATNVSAAHKGYLLEISSTTFNKNYISVNISNSAGISDLQMFLIADVFTSRSLPFTPYAWPHASMAAGDLRYASGPTTDVTSPYLLQNYALSNLKQPYTNQPAHIGVQISDFGNVTASGPSAGVIIGHVLAVNDYNIFDNVGTGIDATNTNLTAFSNIFQNLPRYSTPSGLSGGTAIRHNITSLMNAGLSISPPSANINKRNFFWNCYMGVDATNVYQLDADYVAMRSNQNSGTLSSGAFLPGNTGIALTTNRFTGNIQYGDFNNIRDAVKLNITSGVYDLGGGSVTGTAARNFIITQDYFGAEVSSSMPLLSSEFMFSAVSINGLNSGSWALSGKFQIINNKVDRAYNGILVNGMNSFPTTVTGNNIRLADNILSQPQYGIELLNTKNKVVAGSNTIRATGTGNTNITAFYCFNNVGSGSPLINCNDVADSYTGFTFVRSNPGTAWKGNRMQNHKYGMLLLSNAVIGQQGSSGDPSDNRWLGSWTSNFHTYVNSSNAALSQLWVKSTTPFNPLNNGSSPAGTDYTSTGNVFTTTGTGAYSCPATSPGPNYRTAATDDDEVTGIQQSDVKNNWGVTVFPNPASDHLVIECASASGNVHIRLMDITGKLVFEKQLGLENGKAGFDFDVEQGVYMLELINDQNQKMISKLVIAK